MARPHVRTRDELAPLEPLQTAVWVFDIEGRTMWWANASARRLWEADDLDEMLARDYTDMSESTITRLQRYWQRMERGEVISDQWTFYPRGQVITVRCTFSGIDIEDGRMAMLSEAVPDSDQRLEADALRSVEALRHTSSIISMYTPTLELLMANPAALRVYPDAGATAPAPTRLPERVLELDARQRLVAAIREGREFKEDVEVWTADGPRWHAVEVEPTRDPLEGGHAVLINEDDVTVRRRLLASLDQTRANFASIVEEHSDGLIILGQDGRVRFVNTAGSEMLGPAGIIELGSRDLPPDSARDLEIVAPGGERGVGEVRVLATSWAGQPARLIVIRDVSELRQAEATRAVLEERIAQTQRLDSLGRLAGGVAHDFNNLLGVILGTAELLTLDLDEDDPRREDVAAIVDAAQRGSDLTRQLLAVGRRQHGAIQRTHVNTALRETSALLGRVLGEDIELRLELHDDADGGGHVMIDPSQLEQVVLNLATNARQALGGRGGSVRVATRSMVLGREAATPLALEPGPHLELCVEDSGDGIPPDLIEHVFDPFFTTQDTAEGAGLGLATVYGIVRLARGHIRVDSELGRGTAFTILWPELDAEIVDHAEVSVDVVTGGCGRILLVDDEAGVRRTAAAILERGGYEVITADGPSEALELARAGALEVEAIVTDVVMPVMSGPALVEELERVWGARPVVYMSGYARAASSTVGTHPGFLAKPFTAAGLLAIVGRQLASES